MAKEKEEIKSTQVENRPQNLLISDSLEAFLILSKVGINEDLTVPDMSAKTGINKQSFYRYLSDFKSQKKVMPSFDKISRLADVLGYEIRLVDKKNTK